MESGILSPAEFIRFQSAMVATSPAVKCVVTMRSNDNCDPNAGKHACQRCGKKWKEENR